jgi:hypothetical protein
MILFATIERSLTWLLTPWINRSYADNSTFRSAIANIQCRLTDSVMFGTSRLPRLGSLGRTLPKKSSTCMSLTRRTHGNTYHHSGDKTLS